MSTAIPFKLTVAGQDAAFNLGTINLNVTHVQLGSGNRLANGNEIALVAPQESAAISGHFEVSVGQHRIAAVVTGSVSEYQVSEIGLWSGAPGAGGSVLVFYWSLATGYVALKSANIDFNFESDILFGGVVPGNIAIVADTSFNALSMLAEHEADLNAHPNIDTPPLGDNDKSPVNSEWVQQTIGGVLNKSVAGNSDVALTAVEAGHGILILTGAITGNIALVVPASPTRGWKVRNYTTGAFSITVKTAAGTGVVAAQAADTPVYTDGTDVLYGTSIIPQTEAEAGTATTLRGWSAQRVRQAINAVVKAATETISGIAEIATQAEVNAGTDDTRIVSPAKLRYGFSILLATNGYVVFAAHQYGLIIQWGNAQFAGGSTLTVTLPIQYPNNNFTVIPSNLSAAISCALSSKTTSTFGLSASTTNSGSCGWVSFGN